MKTRLCQEFHWQIQETAAIQDSPMQYTACELSPLHVCAINGFLLLLPCVEYFDKVQELADGSTSPQLQEQTLVWYRVECLAKIQIADKVSIVPSFSSMVVNSSRPRVSRSWEVPDLLSLNLY